MKPLEPRSIEVAERTDIGMLRETNQDACGHADVSGRGRVLFVVDGIGGHAGGDVASDLAVETTPWQLGSGPLDEPGRGVGVGVEQAAKAEALRRRELVAVDADVRDGEL